MPDHTVISDVSVTLAATLTEGLSLFLPAPPPLALVDDLLGNISMDPPTLTVFLYEIVEDPSVKNRPPVRTETAPTVTLQRAPMPLILRYLITPWSNDRVTDQQMLGRAMQTLRDRAILSGPALIGGLAGSAEALHITLSPLTLEERTRIWHAVHKPYRASVAYEVRVVKLDSQAARSLTPVAERILDGGIPRVIALAIERRRLFAAIGLRLVDSLNERPPLGRIAPALDVQDGGVWRPATTAVRMTPGGIVTVPSLGRTARPSEAPVRHYRIRLAADLYVPLYRATDDGVEFDVHPYNDEIPPAVFATGAIVAELVPAAAYPFPAHLRVLRGVVVDAAGAPVSDALVTEGANDLAITGSRGEFALPLRIALDGVPVAVDAAHPRTGRTGSIQVTLPGDLGQSQTIQVS